MAKNRDDKAPSPEVARLLAGAPVPTGASPDPDRPPIDPEPSPWVPKPETNEERLERENVELRRRAGRPVVEVPLPAMDAVPPGQTILFDSHGPLTEKPAPPARRQLAAAEREPSETLGSGPFVWEARLHKTPVFPLLRFRTQSAHPADASACYLRLAGIAETQDKVRLRRLESDPTPPAAELTAATG